MDSYTRYKPIDTAGIREFYHLHDEGMEKIRQSDQIIIEAKEQLENGIKNLVGRLNAKANQRIPFNISFKVSEFKYWLLLSSFKTHLT